MSAIISPYESVRYCDSNFRGYGMTDYRYCNKNLYRVARGLRKNYYKKQ